MDLLIRSGTCKLALCSFGKEIQILEIQIESGRNANSETFIFSLTEWTKQFSEENKFLITLFEGRKVAGSATHK